MKPRDPAAVEEMFNAVAPRYDRLNDLLSLGLHRQWKRQLLSWLSPQPDERWLDLCCGMPFGRNFVAMKKIVVNLTLCRCSFVGG